MLAHDTQGQLSLQLARRPFPARSRTGHCPIGYRRFYTAAEATRYAVEELPIELDETALEAGDETS